MLMFSFGKHLWAGAGAALVGSLCCVGPLVFLALGVTQATTNAGFPSTLKAAP
jgi:hypothetical protein